MVDTQMTAGRGERPGQKITTAQVARETLDGMRRDRYEINVAKVKLLKWVNRFAPGVAERILRNV
jgi:hypothetical protein